MSSRAIHVIITVLELLMRILVAICVSNLVIHGFLSSESFKAFETLYIVVPVMGYFFARRVLYKHSGLMLLVHILFAGTVILIVKGSVEEIFVVFLAAVFFMLLSLSSKSQDTYVPLDIGLLVLCFVLSRTTKVAVAAVLPQYSAVAYVVCFFIHMNIKNVDEFLQENAEIKSFRAEQAMNVNTVMMTFFMIFCLVAMFVAPRLHIQTALAYAGTFIWNGVLRVLRKLDFPVGGYELEFENPEQRPAMEDESGGVGLLLGVGEGSVILDTIAVFIGVVLFIVLIILAVRAIRSIHFEKIDGTDKKEFILPNFHNISVEKIKAKKNEEVIHGTNNEKVRKKYKRMVQKNKEKNTVIPKNAVPENITRLAGGNEEITRIYEKARYSNETVTDDEVRQMDWRRKNGK